MAVEAAYVGMKQQPKQMTDRGMWAMKAAPKQAIDGADLSNSAA
ncbi:hypothetical protein [Deinococcus sp. KNUC1210]|nr:hypothetical protein [Deinococcus sp. KNUC1210]